MTLEITKAEPSVISLSLTRLADLVILNTWVTEKGAVPSFSLLPKPPSVFLFVCVTKHDCLRRAGRSQSNFGSNNFAMEHYWKLIPNALSSTCHVGRGNASMETKRGGCHAYDRVERVPLAVRTDQRGLRSIICRGTTSRRRTSIVRLRKSDRKSMGG